MRACRVRGKNVELKNDNWTNGGNSKKKFTLAVSLPEIYDRVMMCGRRAVSLEVAETRLPALNGRLVEQRVEKTAVKPQR